MKLLRLVIWGTCAAPLLVAAEPTRPRLPARPAPPVQWDPRSRSQAPVSEAEWRDVEKWMHENCPHRLQFLNAMGDRPELRDHARLLITERYRQITHTAYQPLRDSLVAETQIQDQIFGTQIKFREARGDRDRRHAARQELKAEVGKLIEAEMQVRNARIGRLQGEVKKLQDNRTAYVEQWTNRMLTAAHEPGGPDTGSPGIEAGPASGPSSTSADE